MKIIDRGHIPHRGGKHYNSNTFPCIVKLPSGRWLAGFKAAEQKGDGDFMHAVMTWSDDEGRSWADPYEPVHLPSIEGTPGQSRILYFLPLGGRHVLMLSNWVDVSDLSKPYYDPQEETLKDTQIFSSFSADDGLSWSKAELVNTHALHGPVPLTGPPLMLKDGTLLCQFEVNKSIGDPAPWVHKSGLLFSHDAGRTWQDPVMVTEEPHMYYWDQRPVVLADGKTVVDFFWTLDGEKGAYQNIHARESPDGGRSWGAIWDTGIYGQPGQPADLGDGRLATIDIDRSVSPVITVRITRDHGKSYAESLVIYDKEIPSQDSRQIGMNEAWDEMLQFSVGHPNLISLGNHELLAYYYTGDHCDHTHIEFVKLIMA